MTFASDTSRRPASAVAATLMALALCTLSVLPGPAAAQQRDPLQTIGETVADRPSPHYAFERFTLSSPDDSRHWRVQLGVPRADAPAEGFPAFWMLDGNAALMEFDDALLADLAAQPAPPVLVFVGYDNALRIDSAARTRDYTPVEGERPQRDGDQVTVVTGGGGADALLEIIERRIRPELARRVATDPDRQTLWGHSLGGLFALHALYTRGGAFDTWAIGSPSLWWGDGALLGAPEQRFRAHNAGHEARVLLSLGGGERARDEGHRDLSDPGVQVHLRRIAAAPADSAARLARRLGTVEGIDVAYREFPTLTHGPMFRASLMWALHAATGVGDRSEADFRGNAAAFEVTSTAAAPAPGLYQAAWSAANDALFVTSAVGRPPVQRSQLLKLDPATLEVIARAEPPAASGRDDGHLVGVYGVGVDDANGHVWVTNTRDDTVAVYRQDNLALVRQFEAGAVPHSRDVIIDQANGRAWVSAVNEGALVAFDTASLAMLDTLAIPSSVPGGSFRPMSLALDRDRGRLYTVSMGSNEAAVIDSATGTVEKVFALPGADGASGVAIDATSGRLYVASQRSGNLLIVDPAEERVLHDVHVGAGALNVAFDPVSGLAFVASRGTDTITVVDADGRVVANLDGGSQPNHLAVDDRGTVYAVNKARGAEDPRGDHVRRIIPAQR